MQAIIAAKDDIFKGFAIIIQVRMVKIATNRFIANKVPRKVAMPLPPLNLKNIGNICPSIAKSATAAKSKSGNLKTKWQIITGTNPLRTSQIKVAAASFLPAMRITLVAPGLWEPSDNGDG